MKFHLVLLLFILSLIQGCKGHLIDENLTVNEAIRLNQVGFYPNQQKIAILLDHEDLHEFLILDSQSNEAVFQGTIGDKSFVNLAGESTRIIDFTEFEKEGEFILSINGLGTSYPFEVKSDIYEELANASIKAFYYQRASIDILPEFAGDWSRKGGHPDDVIYFHPSTKIENKLLTVAATKGWYDAGDYNKYIVNSGITTGTLMSVYEDFPAFFIKQNLNIPESENNIPDILDEVKWNLDWMLSMQDPADGGVFHKLTTASFEGMISPEEAQAKRFMVMKSTAATLDFAAVMAQASRVFKEINPELSIVYLKASEKAWSWALANPSIVYNQDAMNMTFDPDITTGAYGDLSLEDEWIWAASELLVTTQNLEYWKKLENADLSFVLPTWSKVKWLGFYSILKHEDELKLLPSEWLAMLKINLEEAANGYYQNQRSSAFQVAMGSSPRDFVWGSNAVASNQGILMIKAFLISHNKAYLDVSKGILDYLLGRNATGYSYVTGFGANTPLHPHHRLVAYRPELPPIPGFLVGGPNPGQQDNLEYPSKVPDMSYVDDTKSYASNEIAINWNAAFAYLVNGIEAIENQAY